MFKHIELGFGSCLCFGCGRDEWQWHVPKAWATILPGCRAVGSPALNIIMCRLFLCPMFLDFAFSRRCVTKLSRVPVGNGCLKKVLVLIFFFVPGPMSGGHGHQLLDNGFFSFSINGNGEFLFQLANPFFFQLILVI